MDRKQVDFGREKEVFPLVLIQVKSAAKRTVFDLKNKREKTFLPFKTQLFHIQVVRYAASDCASFRFMIGYGPGLVEEAGEEAMIAAFGDESLNMSTNPEGLWYDSSVLQGSNGAVFTFVKDALGATVCNYALAYDAEGVPGKISVDTMQFPASLDDLPTSPSSAPTSSMMFHTRYRHLAAIELIDRTSRLKVSNLK